LDKKLKKDTEIDDTLENKLNFDRDDDNINTVDFNDKYLITDTKLDKIKSSNKDDHRPDIEVEEKNKKSHSKKSSHTESDDIIAKNLKKDVDVDYNLENKLNVDTDNEKINKFDISDKIEIPNTKLDEIKIETNDDHKLNIEV